MSLDLDQLKTVYCLNAVTIRIPRRWNIYPDANEDHFWCFHDDNEETGTLWIGVDRFQFPKEPDPSPLEVFDSWVADMVEQFDGKGHGDFFEDLEKLGDRYLWRRAHDSVEDGEELRFFWYQWMQAYPRGLALITFNFLVLKSQLDDPQIQALIETMDREIRAAEIYPFGMTSEDGGAALTGHDFGPLCLMNFDGRLKLELPQKFLAEGQKGDAWEFEVQYGELNVILRVGADDVTLSDEDGNPVEINDDNCDEILHNVTDADKVGRRVTLVPKGSIVFDTLDDEAENGGSGDWRQGPRRRVLWRHIHYGNGRTRKADIELECARAQHNSAKFLALVQLLDKSVREAEFPGITDNP